MNKIFIVNFLRNMEDINKKRNIGGAKFDRDLLIIFENLGFTLKLLPMISKKDKIITFFKMIYEFFSHKRDIYFFRYPLIYLGTRIDFINILLEKILYKIMNMSGNKIAIIISDLDFIRYKGFNQKSINQEIGFLNNFDYIIAHNDEMIRLLLNNGVDKNKLINQEVGNNLSDYKLKEKKLSRTVVFSGNLSKSVFLNELAKTKLSYTLNLYGIGYFIKDKSSFLNYKGNFSTEDIVKSMEGSWGLIWDGNSINDCLGNYGEYTRINNPSKFSQYIAAGLPVIAWKKAAIAGVIEKYNIGFLVNNLMEIGDILDTMTQNKYQIYIDNVRILRNKVITGYHIKKAINKILMMERK
ncbi:hypothetical protein [Megamonas hypermegale]|uniref:hypothetical protein n=1 Tax=Megamonas hypermegale TaxID=158847 RepID=UPI0026EB738E|nr:hypothetical protein [Megamonas hypermegale]